MICDLRPSKDRRALVGFDLADDAGVYRLGDMALIQTIDVITPIVDDPYLFGRIAAANALSDIYAMGGRPITALNFIAFPVNDLPMKVAANILQGGLHACKEAGCLLLGGHTIRDEEVKYGLSVTGIAKPDKIVTNACARPGDLLILTKPIGTGIISTAVKRGVAPLKSAGAAASSMASLNRAACEAMMAVGVNACTDITGFGLAGHLAQLARASKVTAVIESGKVPLLPGVMDLARKGIVPGGTKNNFAGYKNRVRVGQQVEPTMVEVLFDAQTSGGLLISVPAKKAKKLLHALKRRKIPVAQIIGRVVKKLKSIDVVIE